ncbi:hypothetical protein ACFYXQ_03550 [Nocardia jiangxiensis]|uniref:DNA-directed RNA polymerase specialized sigma subunit, sigma24 family n=1 Tax=Nocardia jiangxiensis TaxID=282685 RepID=A0ABW6RS52_9NOCA
MPQPPEIAVRTWGELRELLLDPTLRIEAVDAIWRWLIERSRSHGPDATLACASLATPMLARIADRFAAPHSTHRHDIESEVLTGLLAQLQRIELDRPLLWLRLRWSVLTAGWLWAQERAVHMPVDDPENWGDPAQMAAREGHPELVLADAVAHGVITAEAAELITITRLDRRSLTSLAAERGQTRTHWQLRKQRQRAEHKLTAWLADRTQDAAHTSATEARAVNACPPNPTTAAGRSAHTQRPPAATTKPESTHQEARRCA